MNFNSNVTRIWEYRDEDTQMDPVKIVLRHNPVTSDTSLSVAGVEQPKGALVFELPKGAGSGRVIIESSASSLFSKVSSSRYLCLLTGPNRAQVQLRENNERLKDQDESIEDIAVELPEVVVDGTKTVWYLIKARFVRVYRGQRREMRFAVHRRFRDFRFAYSQICSAFRGTHMLSSVPKHPPKGNKLLQDHLRADFLEERRQDLENWLRRTLLVPRVAINPDMESLLGMGTPSVREVSVVITEGQYLGLRLKKRAPHVSPSNPALRREAFPQAIVVDYQRAANGQPGVAERSGLVGVGDIVSKIGGESVVHVLYEEIVPRLKNSPKPLIVHFLGYTFAGGANARPDGQAAAATARQQQQQHHQQPPASASSGDYSPTSSAEASSPYAHHAAIDYRQEAAFVDPNLATADNAKESVATSDSAFVRGDVAQQDQFLAANLDPAPAPAPARPTRKTENAASSDKMPPGFVSTGFAPRQQERSAPTTPPNHANGYADEEEGSFEGTFEGSSAAPAPASASLSQLTSDVANLDVNSGASRDAFAPATAAPRVHHQTATGESSAPLAAAANAPDANSFAALAAAADVAANNGGAAPVAQGTDEGLFAGPTEEEVILLQQQQQQQQQNAQEASASDAKMPSLDADNANNFSGPSANHDDDLAPSAYNDDDLLEDVSF